jgi:hypothetical protein
VCLVFGLEVVVVVVGRGWWRHSIVMVELGGVSRSVTTGIMVTTIASYSELGISKSCRVGLLHNNMQARSAKRVQYAIPPQLGLDDERRAVLLWLGGFIYVRGCGRRRA